MLRISNRSVRSDRSLSGFLLLAVVCFNYLTMYPQSSKYWKNKITLTFKFKFLIVLKKMHFISARSDRSVRFAYREKLKCMSYLKCRLTIEPFSLWEEHSISEH